MLTRHDKSHPNAKFAIYRSIPFQFAANSAKRHS